jgi:hypothetical protein
MATNSICAASPCDKHAIKRGLCNAHYLRAWRYGNPDAGGTMFGVGRKFLDDVLQATETDNCVIWPFGQSMGYGQINIGGKSRRVHNFVCAQAHGPAQGSRYQAAHQCGNRLCINPKHLRWATPSENSLDRDAHGTVVRGSRHYLTSLTERDAIAIRLFMNNGGNSKDAADKYGVTRAVVTAIAARRTWKHV